MLMLKMTMMMNCFANWLAEKSRGPRYYYCPNHGTRNVNLHEAKVNCFSIESTTAQSITVKNYINHMLST